KAVVLLGAGGDEAFDLPPLLRLSPGIDKPEHAREYALAVNHFTYSSSYKVIEDPQAFEKGYREKLAKEDPNAPFVPGVMHLSDYGVPDFKLISAPRLSDGKLVFFVVDNYIGVPYRVEMVKPGEKPSYTPMDLTPIARKSK
ncbi:unnamed protein product, partial [Phaeothamnion confervicola]